MPAGQLTAGESLRTTSGPKRLARVDQKPGIHRVYNIEVETEHSYLVTGVGVLSHNQEPCGGAGGGRGKNKLKPHPGAEGPHTSFKRGQDGKVSGYETYKRSDPRNPNPYTSDKRVDIEGAPHYNKVTKENVPTPHVQGKDIPGGVRPARPDELPR